MIYRACRRRCLGSGCSGSRVVHIPCTEPRQWPPIYVYSICVLSTLYPAMTAVARYWASRTTISFDLSWVNFQLQLFFLRSSRSQKHGLEIKRRCTISNLSINAPHIRICFLLFSLDCCFSRFVLFATLSLTYIDSLTSLHFISGPLPYFRMPPWRQVHMGFGFDWTEN